YRADGAVDGEHIADRDDGLGRYPVNFPKHDGRVVGVLIESGPASKLPIQAFHQVHPVVVVVTRQLFYLPQGKAPALLPRNRRHRSHATTWSTFADDSVTQEDEAVIHMRNMGFLHI